MRGDAAFRRFAGLAILAAALITAGSAQAAIKLVPAYTNSVANPVSQPIYVTAPPGDSTRLFVVERGGRIRVAVNGVIKDTPFLDIQSLVSTNGEGGLLSMAFAPDYATSGLFYVYFVEPASVDGAANGDIRIEEFQRSAGNANLADVTTRRLVLEVQHDTYSNHYGGQLQFGPDGVLYAGTGDGGSGGDPLGNGQNPATQLGKLLAIDRVNATASVAAMGLRNPFRFSFDRGSGDLVIGDVGQDKWEEVDYVPAGTLTGLNFGWNCWEGNEHRLPACNPAPYTPPVLTYANPNGSAPPSAAITGGVVVRDPALTSLFGRYLYADFYAGLVHSVQLALPAVTDDRVESDLPQVTNLVAFGEDADAHVYVVSLAGSVQRIVCDGSCDPPPGGGAGGGGTQQPPADQPPAGSSQPPDQSAGGDVPFARDTSAPAIHARAARLQDVVGLGVVKLSVACDEDCFLRATGKARGMSLRGVIRRLAGSKRVVLRLKASVRVRRALARHRGSVALELRARDAAGNLRTVAMTVRVKRP